LFKPSKSQSIGCANRSPSRIDTRLCACYFVVIVRNNFPAAGVHTSMDHQLKFLGLFKDREELCATIRKRERDAEARA